MTFWNRKSKPSDDTCLDPVASSAGTYSTPLDEVMKAQLKDQNAPDPEPNLSTKPKDIVGYCFGYVCPKKHVGSTFENISIDGYKERRVCQVCGAVSKPAVVKRIAEARWVDFSKPVRYVGIKPSWGWAQYFHQGLGFSSWAGEKIWNHYEFVHFLDTPKTSRRKK